MKSPLERARAYLAKLDPAVSGQGGHNQTFNAACKLVEFGLSEQDAWELLWEYNCKCAPPWSERDLRHKLRDAFRRAEPGKKLQQGRAPASIGPRTSPKPAPPLSPAPPPLAPPVEAPKLAPAKYEVIPADLPEPIEGGTLLLLRTVFRPGDGVRIAKGTVDPETGKERPEDSGTVLTAEQWARRLEEADGDPNLIWTSAAGAGVFIGINPMRLGGSSDSDVADFRHALLEWDTLTLDEQWGLLNRSRVPCAAVIYSGGKSVHAWVKIDAKDRAEYDARVRALHEHFAQYGQDTANKNPSRFSRLPGSLRKGTRQSLLAINLGAASWVEWETSLAAEGIGTEVAVSALESFDTSQDPDCLLGRRWLCRGGSLVIVGPSGVGKSSLIMQTIIGWATGSPVFGITPVRPLKCLLVQAENDAGDLAEEYQGVLQGLGLSPWSENQADGYDEKRALIERNLVIRRLTTHTGERFAKAIRILIEKHRPDLVVFDPLLSFVGGDISKQEVCSQFLRAWLNPISESTGCAWVAIHHTGKPPADKKARDGWQTSDWSYSGIGSSELVNWTRASMVLRQCSEGTFQLMFPKRGSRAGATHPDGTPTTTVWLQWANDGIFWNHVQPPEQPAAETGDDAPRRRRGEPDEGGKGGKRGRPSRVDHALAVYPLEQWAARIPPEGWGRNEAAKDLEQWLADKGEDIPASTLKHPEFGALAKLVASGKIVKRDGKYHRPSQGG